MADLDDFFAKKDRKKSKSTKKFPTADELAKKIEDTKLKPEIRPKKEKPVQEDDEGGRANEEEEWKEYEETVKDYTGLKIQVLQGGNGSTESGRDSASEDSAPDGSGKGKGPWNKPSENPEQAAAAPTPAAAPPPEKKEQSKVYVPPGSRKQQAEPVMKHKQTKNAPDIHNDDYFPVLGAGGAKRGVTGGWSAAGGRGSASPAARHSPAQPLPVANSFTHLQDS